MRSLIIEMLNDIESFDNLNKYFNDLSSKEKTIFLNGIKSLKRNVFDEDLIFEFEGKSFIRPKMSSIHGSSHAEKVCLFSTILGHLEGCSLYELKLLVDASLYHDFMRFGNKEDSVHGRIGANHIDLIFNNYDEDDLNIIKCMIDFHSDQRDLEGKMDEYGISFDKLEMVKKLCYIMSDADCLDRARFIQECDSAIDERYFFLLNSKRLVNLAKEVNRAYYLDYYKDFDKNELKSFELPYYHSIGCNPIRLRCILKEGILSHYELFRRKIDFNRNFDGTNRESWISVIRSDMAGKGLASKEFMDQGIILVCNTNRLYEGVDEFDDRLPHKKDDYLDEAFIYNSVDPLDISSIIISPSISNKSIGNLQNFVYNAFDKRFYKNNVNFYKDLLGIKTKKIDDLVNDYGSVLDEFKSLDEPERGRRVEEFSNRLDKINLKINKIIGKYMEKYYSKRIGKEKVTLIDAVKYELDLNNVKYVFTGAKEDEEELFSIRSKVISKH